MPQPPRRCKNRPGKESQWNGPTTKGPGFLRGPRTRDRDCGDHEESGPRFLLRALVRLRALCFLQLAGDDRNQLDGPVAVAPLVVVPADELEEALVQLDGAAGIVDAGALVVDEVTGNDLVGGVAEDALEIGF